MMSPGRTKFRKLRFQMIADICKPDRPFARISTSQKTREFRWSVNRPKLHPKLPPINLHLPAGTGEAVSKADPLHVIERHLIASAIVERASRKASGRPRVPASLPASK